jgi:hypothetical protein
MRMENKPLKRRRKTALDEPSGGNPSPAGSRTRKRGRTAAEIQEEIQRLEVTLAAMPALRRQQALARRDIVPPESGDNLPRRRGKSALPMAARSLRNRERFNRVVQLLLLIALAAAIAGWVRQLG